MPRFIDRLFKFSRLFAFRPTLLRFATYDTYGPGVTGWLGCYTWLGRCIAFKADDGRITWLHEAR
jgi:hypothetical protein